MGAGLWGDPPKTTILRRTGAECPTPAYEELKDKLHDELDEISRKPELGAGDLEIIHKLTDTIKNIDKICMLEDGEGYSEAVDGGIGLGGYSSRGLPPTPKPLHPLGRRWACTVTATFCVPYRGKTLLPPGPSWMN